MVALRWMRALFPSDLMQPSRKTRPGKYDGVEWEGRTVTKKRRSTRATRGHRRLEGWRGWKGRWIKTFLSLLCFPFSRATRTSLKRHCFMATRRTEPKGRRRYRVDSLHLSLLGPPSVASREIIFLYGQVRRVQWARLDRRRLSRNTSYLIENKSTEMRGEHCGTAYRKFRELFAENKFCFTPFEHRAFFPVVGRSIISHEI